MASIEAQLINKLRARLTRSKLAEVEQEFLEEADRLKNQKTKVGDAPSDRAIYIRPLSKQYARKTGKGFANMRGKTNNIERTTINLGNKSSTLVFNDSKSGEIFNYHDKGTAKGGKKREIYEKRAKFVDPKLKKILREGVKGVLLGQR